MAKGDATTSGNGGNAMPQFQAPQSSLSPSAMGIKNIQFHPPQANTGGPMPRMGILANSQPQGQVQNPGGQSPWQQPQGGVGGQYGNDMTPRNPDGSINTNLQQMSVMPDSTIAPSNPQELMRRIMMGQRNYQPQQPPVGNGGMRAPQMV
jgi:hypothetical protein